MRQWVRSSILWYWVMLVFGGLSVAAAEFRIVDLGPAGLSQSGVATGISTSGGTAGYTASGNGNQAVYSTTSGGFQRIETNVLPGVAGSTATAISGNFVAGTFYDTIDHHYHAFSALNGQATDYGTFTSSSMQGASSFGVGVSASGELVGTTRLLSGLQTAFRSSAPGKASLIGLPGDSMSGQAAGVNDKGTVVGSYLNAQGTSRVFVATSNNAVDLLAQYSTRGFNSNTYGSAINNLGAVTGYGDFGGQTHSFYAATNSVTGAKTFVDLGVASGFSSSVSIGINDLGQVVGKMSNQGSNSRAFFWDASVGIIDLNTLLGPTDQNAWNLTSAAGINNSGQIAGQGYVNGQLHGFLLIPVPGSLPFFPQIGVPTPPSLWMALGAFAMVGGWLRFQRGRTAALDAA